MSNINITWIIGNGFDISAGMKTSYHAFYKSEIFNEHKASNSLYEIIVDNSKNVLWSDYEVGLGKYTQTLLDSDIENFCKDAEQFITDFNSYLVKEDESILFSNEQVTAFKKTLFNFTELFREEKRGRLASVLKVTDTTFIHNFIQFNYTSFLDKLFLESFRSSPMHDGRNRIHYKGINVHVHGILNHEDRHNIIMGCDNKNQYNSLFLENPLYASLIDKRNLNTALANQYIEKGFPVIEKANIFISFGTSFGETDLAWWQNIYKRLTKNECSGFLILKYSPDFAGKKNSPTIFQTTVTNAKSDLFRHFTSEEIEVIRHKVFVAIVGDIDTPFNFINKV